MLYGRDSEVRLLTDLISRSLDGTGGALLLHGEAGIGKTALLGAAREAAVGQGIRVLSAVGVQSEASVPYAGLHQLLAPVLDRVPSLMPRQQHALLAAFSMVEGTAPEMFSVGLASLELISGLTEDAPVIMVIDDAQWLDRSSAEVLGFIARRLDAERAIMLLAVRDEHETVLADAGLPELNIARLDKAAARALVEARQPELDPAVLDRVLAEAAGNPLALVELPIALSQGGAQPLRTRLPATRRLQRAFLSRASGLPAATQAALLIAAADDRGDVAEILNAVQAMRGEPASVGTLEPAAEAGLIELGAHEMSFRHPLIRSAIYQEATRAMRLAAHAALVHVLHGHQERRAWHRAAASPGNDDDAALDLEEAALKALSRGAPRAAADALRRAALISDTATHRGRLLLRSAEINFELGDAAAARRQLAEAKTATLLEADRLRLTLWSEALNEESWFTPERVRSFAAVADRLADVGSDGAALALRALWPLSVGCWYGNPAQETRDLVVKTARRLQRSDADPMVLSIAACADPVDETAWIIKTVPEVTPESLDDPAEQHALGASLTAVWAFDLSWPYLCAAVNGLREQGRLGLLGEALASQAWAAILLGKHRLAAAAADESSRLSRDTGRPLWALVADLATATLAAQRGDEATASGLIRATEPELLSVGTQSILGFAQFARGRHAMVNGQFGDAFEQFARVLDPSDIAYHPFIGQWGITDLIEAAVRTGRDDEAQRYLAGLDALAKKTTAPFLEAMAAYARPLVARDEQAEPLYRQALNSSLSSWPYHRAGLLLAQGRWLRRQRRLTEARLPLRAAMESFDALGVKAFGEDARSELRAAGEPVTRPARDALDELTPQELQIAKLAASGMTNREIGQQLFLSHRTVGYHLHRIFPKLGVTSRGQLHMTDLGSD